MQVTVFWYYSLLFTNEQSCIHSFQIVLHHPKAQVVHWHLNKIEQFKSVIQFAVENWILKKSICYFKYKSKGVVSYWAQNMYSISQK